MKESVVVASDSQAHMGGQRVTQNKLMSSTSGELIVGVAGLAIYNNLLLKYFDQVEHKVPMSKGEVVDWLFEFYDFCKRVYGLQRSYESETDRFGDVVCGMVIGTRGGLFHAGRAFDVTEYSDYIAEGSGAEYAMGAGRILYNTCGDAFIVADGMVETACHHSVECGMPVNMSSLEVTSGC